MTALLALLAFSIITALASAAHGGDHAPKGVILAVHAVASAMLGSVYFMAALLWWVLFRRGEHAKAELDFLSGKGGLDKVDAAYIAPLGKLVTQVIVRCKTRRQQEFFVTLLVTAPALGVLAYVARVFG